MRTINGRVMLALAGLMSGLTWTAAGASSTGYQQFNVASDLAGFASFQDLNLVNPWGVVAREGRDLVVADNHAGVLTFYDAPRPVSLITIPAPDGGPGAPTDMGLNSSPRAFMIQKNNRHAGSTLLCVTEDGTILGWNPMVDAANAIIAVDHSADGAIYKGMALANFRRPGVRLYAANFGQAMIDSYDSNFNLVGSFTDENLAAANYAPFGIRTINGHLFVTFAFKANPADGDETAGPGLGYVDEFDTDGRLIRQFAAQGTLNAPWGLALAPSKFGKFANALLVGNFGDGAINAYNVRTGAYLGQISDTQGNVIHNEGLWGLTFPSSDPNAPLYFTAGPGDENHGLLGTLTPKLNNH